MDVAEVEQALLLVVDLAGHRCAIPVDAVVELHAAVEISPLPDAPTVVVGLVNRRGVPTPVLDVRRRLGLADRPVGVEDHLVVVRLAGRELALLVDAARALVAVEAASVDRATPASAGAARTAGVVVLPDGLLAVVDLDAFLSRAEEAELEGALAAALQRPAATAATDAPA